MRSKIYEKRIIGNTWLTPVCCDFCTEGEKRDTDSERRLIH
jgi:hypothetical protein